MDSSEHNHTPPDSNDATAVIRADGERIQEAFRRRDAAAVADCFAIDAVLMPPGHPPICGRAAITEYWRGVVARPEAAMSLSVDRIEVLGGLAIATGRNTRTGRPEDTTAFVSVWRRSAVGWQLVSDSWDTATSP